MQSLMEVRWLSIGLYRVGSGLRLACDRQGRRQGGHDRSTMRLGRHTIIL